MVCPETWSPQGPILWGPSLNMLILGLPEVPLPLHKVPGPELPGLDHKVTSTCF